MMDTVDSKHKKLSMQEIMVRSLHAQKDTLDIPLDHALLSIVAELQMKDSEALQFGNTVFISHYSPDHTTCAMYALNADTAHNYIKNGELYTRYLIKKGLKGYMTTYQNESFGVPFKQIEKNMLGQVHTWKTGKRFATAVMFTKSNKAAKQGQKNV